MVRMLSRCLVCCGLVLLPASLLLGAAGREDRGLVVLAAMAFAAGAVALVAGLAGWLVSSAVRS